MNTKDRWDKTEVIMTVISGVLIPLVLFFSGNKLNESQLERNRILRESELIRSFLPLLDEESQYISAAAFRVLEESLEEPERAIKLAGSVQSEGAIEYLLERSRSLDIKTADLASKTLTELNIIVLMDSADKSKVYDEVTKQRDGTNADDLYGVLKPLALGPIYREEVYGVYHRTAFIALLKPDVIICHFSSFEHSNSTSQGTPDEQLKFFVERVRKASPDTKFIIYSRWTDIKERVEKLGFDSNVVEWVAINPDPNNDGKDSLRRWDNHKQILSKVKELLGAGPERKPSQ